MPFRFIPVLALLAVAAAVFAGLAHALDFDDEDPEPPHPEIGLVYHYEIGTHAGCLPHHVIITSGELPPGLKLSQLNDHTALVDGIATEEGVFSAWMAVKDCENKSAEALFTFDVWARRYGIDTKALRPAVVGSRYSFTLATWGIPSNTTWELAGGSLPAGLTLSKEGAISGTPTGVGSSTFTVRATGNAKDFTGTRLDSREFTLSVTQALSAKLSQSTAEVGIPVRATLVATGGRSPYTWSASAPAWLHVGADGVVSGTPTSAGPYVVATHLVDASGSSSDVQLRLVVRPRLAIATTSLPRGTAGHAYRARLAVRGGVAPLRWSATLPGGLKLDARKGTISGTAPAAGTFRVTLRIRDGLGAVSTKRLGLTVR
jgi:hypothetical protein